MKTFTITGKVVELNGTLGPADKACVTASFQFDVYRGTQVVVSSPSGAKVALGHVGAGLGSQLGCTLRFVVTGVPDRFPLYTVAVGKGHSQTFSRARLNRPILFGLL